MAKNTAFADFPDQPGNFSDFPDQPTENVSDFPDQLKKKVRFPSFKEVGQAVLNAVPGVPNEFERPAAAELAGTARSAAPILKLLGNVPPFAPAADIAPQLPEIANKIEPKNQNLGERILSGQAGNTEISDLFSPTQSDILKEAEKSGHVPYGKILASSLAEGFTAAVKPMIPTNPAEAATLQGFGAGLNLLQDEIPVLGKSISDLIFKKRVIVPQENLPEVMKNTYETWLDTYAQGKSKAEANKAALDTFEKAAGQSRQEAIAAAQAGQGVPTPDKTTLPSTNAPGGVPATELQIPGKIQRNVDVALDTIKKALGSRGEAPIETTGTDLPGQTPTEGTALVPKPGPEIVPTEPVPPSGINYLVKEYPGLADAVSKVAPHVHPEIVKQAAVDATAKAIEAQIRGASAEDQQKAALDHFVSQVHDKMTTASVTELAPKPKAIRYDDEGVPIRPLKSTVDQVDLGNGQTTKISHQEVLNEAHGLLRDAKQGNEDLRVQRGLDQLPKIRWTKDLEKLGDFDKSVFPHWAWRKFFSTNPIHEEMSSVAQKKGIPESDLIKKIVDSVKGTGTKLAPENLGHYYDEALRNLRYFAQEGVNMNPEEEFGGIAAAQEQPSLFNVPKENVTQRYERLVKEGRSKGLNPVQAIKYAKEKLSTPPSSPETLTKQPELGGGVSFGHGGKATPELFEKAASEAYVSSQTEIDAAYGDKETFQKTIDNAIGGLRGNSGDVSRLQKRLEIYNAIKAKGFYGIVGSQARNAEELAELTSIARNPAVEILQWVYGKGDTVIHHEAFSLGLPNTIPVPNSMIDAVNRKSDELGADWVVAVHNHPTGDPTPSGQGGDVSLHYHLLQKIPKYKYHIVHDHDRFAMIDDYGAVHYKPYLTEKPNFTEQGLVKVSTPQHLATYAGDNFKNNKAMVVYMDNQNQIYGHEYVNPDAPAFSEMISDRIKAFKVPSYVVIMAEEKIPDKRGLANSLPHGLLDVLMEKNGEYSSLASRIDMWSVKMHQPAAFAPPELKGMSMIQLLNHVGGLPEETVNRMMKLSEPNPSYQAALGKQRGLEGIRAAVRDPQTGEIYSGSSHSEIIGDLIKSDANAADRVTREVLDNTENAGFMDEQDEFITRRQAERRYGILNSDSLRAMESNPSYGGLRPTFFSAVEQAITDRMPAKANPQQVEGLLKNTPGVKQEEIDWLGLPEFLKGKTSVTKDELQNFIRENNVQVQEVMNQTGKSTIDMSERTKQAKEVISILDKADFLGFDNPSEALQAIREHPDYETRWDLASLSDADKKTIRQYHDDTNRHPTKFEKYTLPGGENYRELLLTLPTENPSGKGWDQRELARIKAGKPETFKSSHFPEENILAHIRFNDRTDAEGNKVLFLEEVQSDWHQKGRTQGYKESKPLTDAEESEYQRLMKIEPAEQTQQTEDHLQELIARRENEAGVPDAPFKKTWHELALKRMLRYAAENGYDKIAWTTGEQQAERYDLSKQVSSIAYSGSNLQIFDKTGGPTITRTGVHPEDLPDIIGKEASKKLMEQPKQGTLRTLSGLDLKVGGEGMKGFYDQMIPSFLNKYTKRWGGRVGESEVGTMGLNLSGKGYQLNQFRVFDNLTGGLLGQYDTKEQLDKDMARGKGLDPSTVTIFKPGEEAFGHLLKSKVPSLDITPSMKESVMQGQALFEKTAEYNPKQEEPVVNRPFEVTTDVNDKTTAEGIREKFAGIKNEQIVRGNQLASEIKRNVPNEIERQGMFWYKAANGNLNELASALDNPALKEYHDQIVAGMKLSPNALRMLEKVNQYYDQTGTVSKEIGTIGNILENYQNRIYLPEKPQDFVKTETKSGIKQTTRHGLKRVFKTEFEAAGSGKKFATTDIADALSIHNEEMARVNTSRKMADALVDKGLAAWKRDIPDGWEKVGNLQKRARIKDKDGKPVVGDDGNQLTVTSQLVAPKGIVKGLSAIADPNYVKKIESLRNLQRYQGLVKTVDLSFSFFHHLSMLMQTIYQGDIGTMIHLPKMNEILSQPEFQAMERDFALHTGMSAMVEANQDILRNLTKNSGDTFSKIVNLPVVRNILHAADKSSDFLFGKIQRLMKVYDYGEKVTNWIADHPSATNEEVATAKRGFAKHVNSVYGGLNWEAMGMTKSNLSLLRLVMLAPDWTISNLQLLGGTFKSGTNGSASRGHILRALIIGITLTEGLNKLLTGHFTDKNKPGHKLEIEISPDVYVSMFRGGIGDITKFGSMVTESGLAGVSRFAQGKLSPVLRTGVGLLTNTQYTGRPITKKNSGPARGTYDTLAYLLQSATPFPLGGSNFLQYLKGGNVTVPGSLAVLSGVGRYSKGKQKAYRP